MGNKKICIYYVCNELSRRGWKCIQRKGKGKGFDIVISRDGKECPIKIKTLKDEERDLPFGSKDQFDNIIKNAKLVIVCTQVNSGAPNIYILTSEEVKQLSKASQTGTSFWLPKEIYLQFKNAWNKLNICQD